MARRCRANFVLALALSSTALAFLPAQNPPWPPSYAMNRSTISMACNRSGWFDADLASQIGVVSFDWSNNKANWAAAKPMTCQEDLLQQAQQVAAKGSGNRVFTYFNLVKALPWYTAVRELLEDEAYSGFFLRYGLGTPPASPACDPVTGDCSSLFHDQLQTPAVPGSPPPFAPDGVCDSYCDCGKGVPCGEYLWDHRNASVAPFLIKLLLGPSFLGAADGLVSGVFLDDFWCSDILNGTCTDPVQGASETDREAVADMGLSDADVLDITHAWLKTHTAVQAAILGAGGYTWSLLPGQANANASPRMLGRGDACVAALRAACAPDSPWQSAPLLMGLTPSDDFDDARLPHLEAEVAAFLLMRGPHAFLGWGVWGMSWPAGVTWKTDEGPVVGLPPLLRTGDWGSPAGTCEEVGASGVFERQYQAGRVSLDCHTYQASIPRSL